MRPKSLPENPVICFAHSAYQLQNAYEQLPASERPAGATSFEVTNKADLAARIGEANVLVLSGFWDNAFLSKANRLAFVQSASAGVNQYDQAGFRQHGVRLASAQGANEQAVSEHAIALMLAMARRIPEVRDNQANKFWRPMQSNHATREDVIGGKTLVIIGLGRIGALLAGLAKAFGMRVIGVRRDPAAGRNGADEVVATADLQRVLPLADYVALTCPLTDETKGIINAQTLAAMKPGSILVNAARGGCVVEPDLIAALESGHLAGAALDVTVEEPLPASSPLWSAPNTLITPHTAGETRAYEANVVALLIENLAHLRRGEPLVNQIV